MKHARYCSPSSLARSITCTKSMRLNAELEGRETFAAAEGTVAHHVAEFCMNQDIPPQALLDDWFYYMGEGEVTTDSIVGLTAMWEFQCDEEMVACLSSYIAHCARRPGTHYVEVTVDISEYCPMPDQFGTSDHVSIDEAGATIYVDDLKYGKGVKVSPEENWQAIAYALGTLIWLRKKHPRTYEKIKHVVIGIYQPRLDNIDEWITTVDHVLELGEYIRERLAIAWSDKATFNPSKKACQFCKVVPCKAEMEYISDELIEGLDTEQPVTAEIIESEYLLKPEEAEELWLKKGWFDNAFRKLHDYLFRRISDNQPSTLLRMGEGRASRYWKNEQKAEEILEEFEVERIYVQKFISPAQAEKKLNKKQKEAIAPLIGKKPGAPRLVPAKSEHRDYGSQLTDDLDNLDDDDLGLD